MRSDGSARNDQPAIATQYRLGSYTRPTGGASSRGPGEWNPGRLLATLSATMIAHVSRMMMLSLVLSSAACSHDWDKLLPQGSAGVGGNPGGSGGSGGSGGAGAMGGSAGTSGSGGSAGSDGGPSVTCADSTMVLVAAGFGVQYCVDRTEVTNTDYEGFLSNPATLNQPNECSWNTDFTPAGSWPPPPGEGNRPVAFVDWCDAWAYCASVNKRLCGKLGGGSAPFGSHAEPQLSEWFNACSNGGNAIYPYGNTYQSKSCNGQDFAAGSPVQVGGQLSCNGGVDGLLDMSGNVFEWEDSCADSAGQDDKCRIRGGGFSSNQANLRCDVDASANRNAALITVGVRCCADAVTQN